LFNKIDNVYEDEGAFPIMDFSFKKPLHLLALLIFASAIFFVIVSPILSFIGIFPTTQTAGLELTEAVILISSLITILIFVGTPFIWYLLVNQLSIRKMLSSLQLRKTKLDEAILWGVLGAIIMFIIIIIIGYLLVILGVNQNQISNIQDLAGRLSIASMIFVILFQSVGEEIFFRGFLMKKLEGLSGKNTAILSTAILFGVAHMSYGKIYPVIMPIFMGIILGLIVYKTNNLMSAIVAHLLFNLTSFLMYLLAQSYQLSALIL
jgi:membrane protease YdiL (CAAX protease family)